MMVSPLTAFAENFGAGLPTRTGMVFVEYMVVPAGCGRGWGRFGLGECASGFFPLGD